MTDTEPSRIDAILPPYLPPDEFARTFAADPNVDYGWVVDFAFKAYEETARITEELDGKAEKLVNFTSVGFAVVVGFLAPLIARGAWWLAVAAAPSLLLALLAVLRALAARWPVRQSVLPRIDVAFQFADYYREAGTAAARAGFAAKLHEAREARSLCNAEKARLVKLAHAALLGATGCLLLLMVALALTGQYHPIR